MWLECESDESKIFVNTDEDKMVQNATSDSGQTIFHVSQGSVKNVGKLASAKMRMLDLAELKISGCPVLH